MAKKHAARNSVLCVLNSQGEREVSQNIELLAAQLPKLKRNVKQKSMSGRASKIYKIEKPKK